jgi:hypothetical protein
MNKQYVIDVLLNNGIDANYLSNNDNEIEYGGDEWLNVISEITGKDDERNFTDEDDAKIQQFMGIINRELNIRFF